jgi:hypothetical protein
MDREKRQRKIAVSGGMIEEKRGEVKNLLKRASEM